MAARTSTSPASPSAPSSVAAILPRSDIAAGDAILGLASSGLHSNGYSLVRRIVAEAGVSLDRPAPFGGSLGDALLAPTRIYVKPLLRALREIGGIKALAHITGGGFVDNIPRVLPGDLAARIDLAAIAVPPVFAWLAERGPVAEGEMLRTFNCGVGMVVVAPRTKPTRSPPPSPPMARRSSTSAASSRATAPPVVFDGHLALGAA